MAWAEVPGEGVETTAVHWLVFVGVIGIALALVLFRRARVRRAIEELDGCALLTHARWDGDVLLCGIAGGVQLRVDVAALKSIDWREYGDPADPRGPIVAFRFRFGGVLPPVSVMGSARADGGSSDAPVSVIQKELARRSLIGSAPDEYVGFGPVASEARRLVSTVRCSLP